jgi:predicted ester cyclase
MALMILFAVLAVGSQARGQESQPAQPTDPESVYRAEYEAQNAGDTSASRFAQDVVSIPIPTVPGADPVFIGWEAIHKITEEVVAAHAYVDLRDFQVNGDMATFTVLVTADFFRDLGITEPLEHSGVAIVRDGLIQFEAWVMTEESQARLAAAIARQENKAVVERLYEEVLNQKELTVADELYADAVVDHDAGDEGSEAVQAGLAALLAGLPDLQVTTELWSIDGDLVTTRVTFSGTHQGEWLGVAPTGKPVTWSHIDIHRVQGGKITDIWHTVPVGDILQQLGYEQVPPAQ